MPIQWIDKYRTIIAIIVGVTISTIFLFCFYFIARFFYLGDLAGFLINSFGYVLYPIVGPLAILFLAGYFAGMIAKKDNIMGFVLGAFVGLLLDVILILYVISKGGVTLSVQSFTNILKITYLGIPSILLYVLFCGIGSLTASILSNKQPFKQFNILRTAAFVIVVIGCFIQLGALGYDANFPFSIGGTCGLSTTVNAPASHPCSPNWNPYFYYGNYFVWIGLLLGALVLVSAFLFLTYKKKLLTLIVILFSVLNSIILCNMMYFWTNWIAQLTSNPLATLTLRLLSTSSQIQIYGIYGAIISIIGGIMGLLYKEKVDIKQKR